MTEFERNRWRHANKLLDRFKSIPGTEEDGTIDEPFLLAWTSKVRLMAESSDRLGVSDICLGRLFSQVPERGDAQWPPLPICNLMESIDSDDIFNGFSNGLRNKSGVITRGATTGGDPERQLASKYRSLAKQHQSSFPKLASALINLAKNFEQDAKREDEEAARRRLER